jgi:histidine triad (HIT) family protein
MSLVLPTDEPCSFCDYLAGARPYTILARDSLTATLVTREQRGVGHVLGIPITHRETILEVDANEVAALMAHVQHAARALVEVYHAEGIAVWQNNGTPAHQSVPHVHFHVAATLPGGGTDWEDVARLSLEETEAIAARLRPYYET